MAFDTGGTILDWHSGINAKLAEIVERQGIEADEGHDEHLPAPVVDRMTLKDPR